MTTPPPDPAPSLLRPLGIDAAVEQTYRLLLVHRSATAADAATLLAISPAQAEALLQQAEQQGLASHSPEIPRRYVPIAPDLAVDFLIQQQRAAIESARGAIAAFQALAPAAAPAPAPELVQIITNRVALGRILDQQQRDMAREVFAFQRAPELYPDSHQKVVPRHLRVRSISDASYIRLPGRLENLQRLAALGEEARYAHALPMKMIVWDRRIALIPLSLDRQEGPALLVRGSSLLDALCVLFDLMWDRATPVAFAAHQPPLRHPDAAPLSAGARRVLALLAAGLNDKVITHNEAISRTTLNRHLAELMRAYDARTRFQLGWRAASARTRHPPEPDGDAPEQFVP